MKEFFLLVFVLFVFSHHEGSCLSEDPPFSAVRHLRKSQSNNMWSEHLSEISRSGVAFETRAGRPLFSWDTVSPTRLVTFDENQNNTKLNGSSEVLKADTKKQKRKKEQNRKKKKVSTALGKDQDNSSGSLDRDSSLRTVSTSSNSENNNVPDKWLTGVGQRRQKNKSKKEKNKIFSNGKDGEKKKKPKMEDIKNEKVKKEKKRKKDKKNREQGVRQGKKRRKEEQISDNFLPHVSRKDKFIKNRSKNKFKEEENNPELIPALPSSSENIVDAMTGRHKKRVRGNKLNLAGTNIDTMDANNEINRREYLQLQELEMNKSADSILISTEDNTLPLEIPLFMLNENTARRDDKLKETDLLENNFILTTDPAGISTSIEKSHITTNNQEITTEYNNNTGKNNIPEKSKVAQTVVLKETGSHILESANISDSEHLGDLSCLSGTFLPAPIVANAAIKYTRGRHLEAEYECQTDYKLEPAEARVLVCSKRQWLGDLPHCVPLNEISSTSSDSLNVNNSLACGENRGGCDQLCTLVENKPVCSCFRGFKLQGTICHDIDECSTSNAGCEVACHNKPGSYECACLTGFRLSVNGKTCLDINECLLRNGHGPCQDTCYNLPGSYSCSCKGIAGTRLAADNHTCEDVDECARNNAGCSHTCLNTLGRAFCLCPIGFMLGTDWKTCHDIDECADPELQEGERCSIGCINTMGSYQCVDLKDQAPDDLPTTTATIIITAAATTTTTAATTTITTAATTTITTAAATTITTEEFTTTMPTSPATTPLTTMAPIKCLPGFEVGPLGSCKDVDECSTNNGGCSHTCKNTLGGAFCLCPPSFMLGSDWKTCKAMDVRSEVQQKITFICAPGHTMTAGGRCKDIDECAVQNGGCMQGCVNTRGSFRCLCGRGFFLAADGKSCIEERVDIVCPPLPTPSYGYLHCTRRAFMVAPERWRARWRRRIVNHAGAVCELRCPHGYKVQGEYRKVCESDGHWAGPQDGYCMPFPKPKIECPHNISVEVEPGQDTAFVAFPQPLTDVDWFKNVVSKPKWGKLLEADLQPGHWTVTFTARHPISRHTASCILGITVSISGISTESSLESDVKH